MTSDFASQVQSAFSNFIRTCGAEIVGEDYSPEHFGNAFVDLRCGNVVFRIVRERGQIFADLTRDPESGEWFDLEVVLRLLGDEASRQIVASGHTSLEQIADVLEEHSDSVETLFSPFEYSVTQSRLEELKRERVKERFGYDPDQN